METFASATVSRGMRKKQAKADLFSSNRNIYQKQQESAALVKWKFIWGHIGFSLLRDEMNISGVTLEMHMFGPSLPTTG